MAKTFLILLIFLCFLARAYPFTRKKEQFQGTFSYLALPAPYQLPGIGSGWTFYAAINNFAFNYMDVFAYTFTGAAEGSGVGFKDMHLIKDTLFINYGAEYVKKAKIQAFDHRGMSDGGDDYSLLKGHAIVENYGGITLSLLERRVNFYHNYYRQDYVLDGIETAGSDQLVSASFDQRRGDEYTSSGVILDLTDDYQDPEIGFRADISRISPNNKRQLSDASYHIISQNYTLYIPFGSYSTWAFNFFKSDAYVAEAGTTDTAQIKTNLGFNDCSLHASVNDQIECNRLQNDFANRLAAQNRYGTASNLGGRWRMRAFPLNRFVGSHSLFYGTEIRWNLDKSLIPFDWLLVRDTRSGLQFAFFYEWGAASDKESELTNNLEVAYGAGLRLVTASGFVYRMDWGQGDEGSQYTLIASYPW